MAIDTVLAALSRGGDAPTTEKASVEGGRNFSLGLGGLQRSGALFAAMISITRTAPGALTRDDAWEVVFATKLQGFEHWLRSTLKPTVRWRLRSRWTSGASIFGHVIMFPPNLAGKTGITWSKGGGLIGPSRSQPPAHCQLRGGRSMGAELG